jgi:hypothetical protein
MCIHRCEPVKLTTGATNKSPPVSHGALDSAGRCAKGVRPKRIPIVCVLPLAGVVAWSKLAPTGAGARTQDFSMWPVTTQLVHVTLQQWWQRASNCSTPNLTASTYFQKHEKCHWAMLQLGLIGFAEQQQQQQPVRRTCLPRPGLRRQGPRPRSSRQCLCGGRASRCVLEAQQSGSRWGPLAAAAVAQAAVAQVAASSASDSETIRRL